MLEREEADLDYASEWATMTFEVRERAAPSDTGLTWSWILGAALALAALLVVSLRRAQ